jgi:hypothetical protein
MLQWKDEYLDLPINQLKKIVKSTGYNGIVYVEHTWRQLKKSMEWYERQCQLVSYQEDVILREIDLQRMSGISASPFKRQDLLYLSNHKKEPIKTIDYSKNLCPILIYEELQKNYVYILSIDPAEGLSQDNNAFTLINPYTLCPAAEFKSPYISPPDFTKLAIKFMDDCCPLTMVVIEANRREMVNRFLESKYKHRLYYDVDKLNASQVIEKTDEYGALKQQANERRAFGFDTTKASRILLFDILENLVTERKEVLYGKYIVEDILTLERKPNGKILASDGNHDDNIMSYLIGLAVYYHATNLEDYGIIRGSSAPMVNKPPSTMLEVRENMKKLMNIIPDNMKEFFTDFMKQTDEVESAENYERQIQRIQRMQEADLDIGTHEDTRFIDPRVEQDRWAQVDRELFESNFNNGDDDDNYSVDIGKIFED